MIIGGTNPNAFKTLSDVFVAADGYMYFRGTDDTLWRSKTDGTDGSNPNGFKTLSDVFVAADGYMYFRGTDDTLWRSKTDGTDGSNPNGFKTLSNVFVAADGYMYFRGTDDTLWRSKTDGTDGSNPNGFKTLSNVFVAADGYMYFRGTDDTLWRSKTDGTDGSNPNGFKTLSDVFVAADGYMYFRGTDDTLWRSKTDGTDGSNPNGFKTLSDVFVAADGYMYFRGTDDTLWRSKTDGSLGENPGDHTALSNILWDGGSIYFRDTDNLLFKYNFNEGSLSDFAAAAVVQLQGWYNWDTGLWNGDQKQTSWWHSANSLNALITFMSITKTDAYNNVIVNTFNKNKDTSFFNSYYDDEGWWALTWLNAYELTGAKQYLSMSETIFKDIADGWDDVCNGGIYWRKDHGRADGSGIPYKNAIPNELFLAIATRLFLHTSNNSYLNCAIKEWNWFDGTGLINNKNLINDGLNTCCKNSGEPEWTYNQGVILSGFTDLWIITKDFSILLPLKKLRTPH